MHPKEISILDYTYDLPEDKIAVYPIAERQDAKLLIYKKGILRLRTSENFDKLIECGARDLFKSTLFSRSPKNKISTKDNFEIERGEINDIRKTM
jgi:hypothetical protein